MESFVKLKVANNCENKESESCCVVPKRKLHVLSLFFICIVTFGALGFSIQNLNISTEIKNITSSWAPNVQDLGKLKFVVNQESQQDVFSHVSEMEMPFENTYVSELEQGVFLVNGLGGLVVKSCLDGKVTKVEGTNKKEVHVSHGKGLVSVYEEIDVAGVKVNDEVKKNTPLGVSYNSVVKFKILYRNKTITGLEVKDGELTFF